MGCGGSKEEVIVGNTLKITRQNNKNTDDSKHNNNSTAVSDVIGLVKKKEDAKEVSLMLSPDCYFSSRNDQDALLSVEVDSTGYETSLEDQDDHNISGERKAEGVGGEGGGGDNNNV